MRAVLWMFLGTVWISDGQPARGGDSEHEFGWWKADGPEKMLVLEKRKSDGEGRYVLPYRVPDGGSWQPGSRGPIYAKATCTSVPGRVLCRLGRYTFVINNGEHKMDPEVIERFAAMLYHRTQEGDTNFDVAVESPTKEEAYCADAGAGEQLQSRDVADESPVYVECSPVRDERRGEVLYSCKRHGLGKRGALLTVYPSGSVTNGRFILPFRRVKEKRSVLGISPSPLKGTDAKGDLASAQKIIDQQGLASESERAPNGTAERPSISAAEQEPSATVERVPKSAVSLAPRATAQWITTDPAMAAEPGHASPDSPTGSSGTWAKMDAEHRAINPESAHSKNGRDASQIQSERKYSRQGSVGNLMSNIQDFINPPLSLDFQNSEKEKDKREDNSKGTNERLSKESVNTGDNKNTLGTISINSEGTLQAEISNDIKTIDRSSNVANSINKQINVGNVNKYMDSRDGNEIVINTSEMKTMERLLNAASSNKDVNSRDERGLESNSNDTKRFTKTSNMQNYKIYDEVNALGRNENVPNLNNVAIINNYANSRDKNGVDHNSNDIKSIEKNPNIRDINKNLNSQEANEIVPNTNVMKTVEQKIHFAANANKEANSRGENLVEPSQNDLKINEKSSNIHANINNEVNSQVVNLADQFSQETKEKNSKQSANTNLDINSRPESIIDPGSSNIKFLDRTSNVNNQRNKEVNTKVENAIVSHLSDAKKVERNSNIEATIKKAINPQDGTVVSSDVNAIEKNSNFAANLNKSPNSVENVATSNNIEINSNITAKKGGTTLETQSPFGEIRETVNTLTKTYDGLNLSGTKLKATGPLAGSNLDRLDNNKNSIESQPGRGNCFKNNGEKLGENDGVKMKTEESNVANKWVEQPSMPIAAENVVLSKNINEAGAAHHNYERVGNYLQNENAPYLNYNLRSDCSKVSHPADVFLIAVNQKVDTSKVPLQRDIIDKNKKNMNKMVAGNIKQKLDGDLEGRPLIQKLDELSNSFNKLEGEESVNDINKAFILDENAEKRESVGTGKIVKGMIEPNEQRVCGSLGNKQESGTQQKIGEVEEDAFELPPAPRDLQENLAGLFQRLLPPPEVRNFTDICINDFVPGMPWCPNTPTYTQCKEKGCVTRCQDNMNMKWLGAGSRRKRTPQPQWPADLLPEKRQVCGQTTCSVTYSSICSTTTQRPTTTPCLTSTTPCLTTTSAAFSTFGKTPANCPTTNPCANTSPSSSPCPTTCPPVTCPTTCGPPLDPPGEVPACFKPPLPKPCYPVKTTQCPRLQRRAIRGHLTAKKKKKMALRQAAKGNRPEEYYAAYI